MNRRSITLIAIGSISFLADCRHAYPQSLLSKIPWGPIIEGVSAGLTTIEIALKLRGEPSEGAKAPKLCSISEQDTEELHNLCISIEIDVGDGFHRQDDGLTSALLRFLKTQDRTGWLRVKLQAKRFLEDSVRLLEILSRKEDLLSAVDSDSQRKIFLQMRQGLKEANNALKEMQIANRIPNADDRAASEELLQALKSVPTLGNEAENASRELLNARSKMKCP